jgi:hypothetical protein
MLTVARIAAELRRGERGVHAYRDASA